MRISNENNPETMSTPSKILLGSIVVAGLAAILTSVALVS